MFVWLFSHKTIKLYTPLFSGSEFQLGETGLLLSPQGVNPVCPLRQ
jgi:hypothetical protein